VRPRNPIGATRPPLRGREDDRQQAVRSRRSRGSAEPLAAAWLPGSRGRVLRARVSGRQSRKSGSPGSVWRVPRVGDSPQGLCCATASRQTRPVGRASFRRICLIWAARPAVSVVLDTPRAAATGRHDSSENPCSSPTHPSTEPDGAQTSSHSSFPRGKSATLDPLPDGAHAVGAPLRPPSGRPPLRAHRVANPGANPLPTQSTTGSLAEPPYHPHIQHADSKTTQIYAHYQPSDQEADAVDRAFA
jgi:hypothetical protein